MKKLIAIVLAIMILASMATIVSAANTTTLTTTVPAATYTLNIPADQEIPFGAKSTSIGELTVSDAVGFAVGKSLRITLTYSDFTCADVSTTIPMKINAIHKAVEGSGSSGTNAVDISSGDSLLFRGTSSGEVAVPRIVTNGYYDLSHLVVKIDSEDWGKALAGEYTTTITFTAEVVAE